MYRCQANKTRQQQEINFLLENFYITTMRKVSNAEIKRIKSVFEKGYLSLENYLTRMESLKFFEKRIKHLKPTVSELKKMFTDEYWQENVLQITQFSYWNNAEQLTDEEVEEIAKFTVGTVIGEIATKRLKMDEEELLKNFDTNVVSIVLNV